MRGRAHNLSMASLRPCDEWPLVLCGPILRRVVPGSVSVFVVVRESCEVTLTVNQHGSSSVLATAAAATLRLGTHLHALVIEVQPSPPLASGTLYEYDLSFVPASGTGPLNLQGLGLLSGALPLGYVAGRKPGFALAPGLADLKIVHGSCRKPHGEEHDMLAALDELIARDHDHPLARPHQLLMTGDQIYADDVAIRLLASLRATAPDLVGWSNDETIPVTTVAGDTVWLWDDRVAPGLARGNFIAAQSSFTSTELDGHLMFLSEFYAMYMFGWSDELWPRGQAGAPDPYTLPDPQDGASGGMLRQAWYWYARKGTLSTLNSVAQDRQAAIQFARTLPLVRRALANVPTLMLFDDHDVSDDWNLHRQWSDQVRASPTGQRITRNALIAYAVFQDWGNHPENYGPGTQGERLFHEIRSPGGALLPPLGPALDAILDLGPQAAMQTPRPDRMCWDFSVEGPEHRLVAIDTRTWRQFPASAKGAPALLSPAALDTQLSAYLPPPGTQGLLTILLSPAPVLGFPPVEDGLQPWLVGRKGPEEYDNEAWASNRPAFEDLLRRLAQFERVVVLSGDVHYGFTNQLAYFRDRASPSETTRARIVQLCASALKNETKETRANNLVGRAAPHWVGRVGFSAGFDPATRTALRAALVDHLPPGAHQGAEMLFDLLIAERMDAPAVVQSGPWFSPQAYAIVHRLADQVPGSDWRYAILFAGDARSITERAQGIADALDAYLLDHGYLPGPPRALARHALLDANRQVVGTNQFGLISFAGGGTGLPASVVHRLYWYLNPPLGGAEKLPGPLIFTQHEVPLTLPDLALRPEVAQW